MDELEKLLAKAESMLDELDGLRGKRAEADDDEAEALGKKIEAKDAEYEALKAKIDALVTAKERRAELKGHKDALEAKGGGDVAPDIPATAKDHRAEQRKKEDVFLKYMQGKDLTPEEYAMLEPQSDTFKEGKDGICIPSHLRSAFMGKRWSKAVSLGKVLLSSGTGQGEGNLVPEEYIERLLELPTEPDHIMGMATIVPTSTGTITLPRLVQTDSNEYGGMSFSIISEGAEAEETEPEFEQVEISTHEVAGYTELSNRMLARSVVDLNALLGRLYKAGVGDFLDGKFMSGSGSSEPLGIVNTSGIRTVTRVAANQVCHTDLVKLKHAVLLHHRGGARFMINDDVEEYLELLEDEEGRPLFSETTASGPYDRLVNYPYSVTMRQPSLGSDGDAIFGNFAEYAIASEEEVVVKKSEHYKFRHARTAYLVYVCVGGQLWFPRAMSVLQSETS